jgi:hypothetical protein
MGALWNDKFSAARNQFSRLIRICMIILNKHILIASKTLQLSGGKKIINNGILMNFA